VSPRTIALGTRGSPLALAQARLVAEALGSAGDVRIVVIETEGDRRAPDTAWGEGAFVAALEEALLDGRVDTAVHSAKDVPTDVDERIRIAAYLPRADPRDALVVRRDSTVRSIDELPPGSRVGTDSPRRAAFLRARRADLEIHPLHGNVDTRLRRLDAGETDALILACAGLDRLGLGDRIAVRLAPDVIPPAPGQGAIAVEVRAGDPAEATLAAIDHRPTRIAVEAERAFLHATGGGCRSPFAALARSGDGLVSIVTASASPNGRVRFEGANAPIDEATALAVRLAVRHTTPIPTITEVPAHAHR
jgi:hydroxymethylbilane synthase